MTVTQLLTKLFTRSLNHDRRIARRSGLNRNSDSLESRQLLTTLIGAEARVWATIQSDSTSGGTEIQFTDTSLVIVEESPDDPELPQFGDMFDIDIDGGQISLNYNLSPDYGGDPSGVVPAGTYYRYYLQFGGLADRDFISAASADTGQTLVPDVSLTGRDRVVIEIGPGDTLGNGFDALINVDVEQTPRNIIGREFSVQNTFQSLSETSGMEVPNGDPGVAVISNGASGPELQSFNDIYDIDVENGSLSMTFNLAPGADDPSGVVSNGTFDRYYFTFALGNNEFISAASADTSQMLVPNISIADNNNDGLDDTIVVEIGEGMQIGDTYDALINFDVDIIGSEVYGRAWQDYNNDGLRTPDEPYLNGWLVHMVSQTGPHRMSTSTRNIDLNHDGLIDPETETGIYFFEGVQNGSYYLIENIPVGWTQSHPVSPVDILAFDLNTSLNLAPAESDFFNWAGLNEKWLYGSGLWFYTTPDGRFHQWNEQTGDGFGYTMVYQLSTEIYEDQSLLYDAPPPMNHVAVVEVPTPVTGLDFGNYLAPPSFTVDLNPETNEATFEWQQDVPGKQYEIWITDINTGKRHEVVTGLNGNSYTTTLPDRRYRVWMRLQDSPTIFSAWSESQEFEFCRDAITPVTDGLDAGIDATPTIQWTSQTDADSYDIQVLNSDGGIEYTAYAVTETSHRISTELRLGVYQVSVRANYTDGSRNEWGPGQQLVIDGKPVVQLTGNLVSWDAVQAATKYEVWVDQVDTNGNRLVRQIVYANDVTDLSYTLPRLPQGNFSLWVRAIRSEGGAEYVSFWSDQLDFQVKADGQIEDALQNLSEPLLLTSLKRQAPSDADVALAAPLETPAEFTTENDHQDAQEDVPVVHESNAAEIVTVMEEFCETGLSEQSATTF